MNEIDLTNVRGITCDSRKVKDGYVFVAIKGVGHDGHDYIADAIKNGASYIVQNPDLKQRLNDQIISSSNQQDKHTNNLDTYDYVQFIESGNTRRDLAVLAAAFYKNQPNTMIAVTGTNGKTSVADFVRQIFIHSGENVASIGTLGVQSNVCSIDGVMTTPDAVTLQSLLADLVNSGVTHGVMEASSHGLHQSRLDGVRLKIAAFTNLTQDHLDYHETMEQYFDAKMRLFKNLLPAEGIAIVNTDDPYGQRIQHDNVLTYGSHDDANMRLLSQKPTTIGQDICVAFNGRKYDVHLPFIGLFQAYNILCAVACCVATGLDARLVFDVLPKLKGVSGRMEFAAKSRNGATAYIDYAHTPDALKNALTSLRPHVKGRLVCVFGAGGDRDKMKRPLMGQIVSEGADIAIITDDNPRTENADDIRNQIFSACSKAENIAGRANAIAYAASLLNADDVLLVAGKGHEQGQTIGTTTHPFDDLTETKKVMEAL